jgi:endonuclease III
LEILARTYPDARCELNFSTPLELLVATILSAQCTDARVNQVTASLFTKYRSAADYAGADPATFEEEIRSTGFFRNKAKNILTCCRQLVRDFGGKVPRTMEELVTLPGVGRKTANILLYNAYGIPGFGVDTHVVRVTNRLGLSTQRDRNRGHLSLLPRRRAPPVDLSRPSYATPSNRPAPAVPCGRSSVAKAVSSPSCYLPSAFTRRAADAVAHESDCRQSTADAAHDHLTVVLYAGLDRYHLRVRDRTATLTWRKAVRTRCVV